MNNLHELWQERARRLLAFITKYGRLVINDHFSIIAFVLLGFMSFIYKDQLLMVESVPLAEIHSPLVVILSLWLTLLLNVGRPIYFTENADASYLFAQGEAWQSFWRRGFGLAFLFPVILILVGSGVVLPFIRVATQWGSLQLGAFLAALLVIKAGEFLLRYAAIFNQRQLQGLFHWPLLLSGCYWSLIGLSLWLGSLAGSVCILVGALLILCLALWQVIYLRKQWLDFDYVIEEERRRVTALYKFVSIFADVKALEPSIHRRQYLDPLLRLLQKVSGDRYGYLYARALLRHNAYSGVWFKVLIFISALCVMTQQVYALLGLGVLGFLFTLIQLVPLANYQQHNPFQQLYPLQSQGSQRKALQKILSLTLVIQGLVFAGIGYYQTQNLWMFFLPLIGGLLPWIYVPFWMRKHLS